VTLVARLVSMYGHARHIADEEHDN
jgi:hypothetical protein